MDNSFARILFNKGRLAPQGLDLYRRQTAAFERKFGRKMGPDDPFFFDPDASTPRFRAPEHAGDAIEVLAGLMAQLGIEAAEIHAFRKTRGLFPTAGANLSPEELAEWNAARDEYRAQLSRSANQ